MVRAVQVRVMFLHGSTELPHDAISSTLPTRTTMDKLPSPQRVRVQGSGGRGPEIPQTNHWKKRRRQTRNGGREDMRERKRTTGWSMGEMRKCFFFLLMIGQSLVGVSAASENAQSNRRQMEGMQGERKMESSWVQINQQNFPTMEMWKRDAEGIKMARCTLQTGSAWSTAFVCSTRSC